MTTESGPADADIPRDLAHRKGGNTVDARESSAPHAHPLTEEQDYTVDTHYSARFRTFGHSHQLPIAPRATTGNENEVAPGLFSRQ
jgi:hypothetical protein